MTTLFLTGTDTEVGKTHVATRLLQAVAASGQRCAGFKPVAAGATDSGEGLRNDDALALQQAGNVDLSYTEINPYCFAPAIAPHVAAAQASEVIDKHKIFAAQDQIAQQADWVLVEGAGGWRVPLNDEMDFADLVAEAGWPVILVVGMRLGCLNHALLTAESIQRRAPLLGWIANCLPPRQDCLEENLETLQMRMPAPLLGVVPEGEGMPEKLDLEVLLTA